MCIQSLGLCGAGYRDRNPGDSSPQTRVGACGRFQTALEDTEVK